VNLYAYVGNDPTALRDPSGLEPVTLSAGAAIAIVCVAGAVAGDGVVLQSMVVRRHGRN